MQTGFLDARQGTGHPARTHADFLGQPIEKGDWVTINDDEPVRVLDLYAEGQFVYERDGRLVTYFCCCVKKASHSSGQSGVFVEGAGLWAAVQMEVAGVGLKEVIGGRLSESAALLLRVAIAEKSEEARVAERWLRRVGLVGCLSQIASRAAADWHAGEGPQSGGGAATSGAGAKRKEGVQPPGDSASQKEVAA